MNKSDRIESFVESLDLNQKSDFDPCYLGYFECFNAHNYYEAHDVLEHLWLKDGREAPDYAFYKGLIQLAGGFVHLKLHFAHPQHSKHGKRLAPARRLFLLASENIAPYGEHHHGLDLVAPLTLARSFAELLEKSHDTFNPWHPERAPRLPIPTGKNDDF